MLKKPPTRHLPVSRFPLLMARSGLGLNIYSILNILKEINENKSMC